MTFAYGVPFKLGAEDFLVDGFLDCSTDEGTNHASEMNWTTQWKWNAGKHISQIRVYTLVSSIQFGKINTQLMNMDENNVSALVKYHF